VVVRTLAVLLALAVWQLVSMAVNMEILLASPVQVFLRLCTIWREPGFWATIWLSMGRMVSGYLLALALGIVLGFFAGRFPLVEILLRPYVVVMKTVPVASFIILSLIWFNFHQLTIFVSFLIAFPVIYSNVVTGFRSADEKLLEMAQVYEVPPAKRLRFIYIPAMQPYLQTSASVSMGMAWKAGVAAEVIGVVDGSIGERLYEAKVYFQNADLLAWTVILVLLSLLLEKLTVEVTKGRFFCHINQLKALKNQQISKKEVTKEPSLCHIKIEDLRKCFDGEIVVGGLNLELPPGGSYCLRGPSGFGKTTILRMLAGILAPDAGVISGVPRRIAFVFQEDRLCEEFTAADNVALVTGSSMTKMEIADQLKEVGLGETKPVSSFSGGMKRRVAIVRAICYDADLLLLDEPFKGLDPDLRGQVADYILRHTAGKTLICVTHDDADAALLHARTIDLTTN